MLVCLLVSLLANACLLDCLLACCLLAIARVLLACMLCLLACKKVGFKIKRYIILIVIMIIVFHPDIIASCHPKPPSPTNAAARTWIFKHLPTRVVGKCLGLQTFADQGGRQMFGISNICRPGWSANVWDFKHLPTRVVGKLGLQTFAEQPPHNCRPGWTANVWWLGIGRHMLGPTTKVVSTCLFGAHHHCLSGLHPARVRAWVTFQVSILSFSG